MSDFEYLTQSVTRGLIEILMIERHLSLSEALATLRSSHTFQLLLDEQTGLYRESAAYVYVMLCEELDGPDVLSRWDGSFEPAS